MGRTLRIRIVTSSTSTQLALLAISGLDFAWYWDSCATEVCAALLKNLRGCFDFAILSGNPRSIEVHRGSCLKYVWLCRFDRFGRCSCLSDVMGLQSIAELYSFKETLLTLHTQLYGFCRSSFSTGSCELTDHPELGYTAARQVRRMMIVGCKH